MGKPISTVDQHYSVRQLAGLLSKSPAWVRSRVKRGDFSAINVGSDLLISGRSVNAFLARCGRQPSGKRGHRDAKLALAGIAKCLGADSISVSIAGHCKGCGSAVHPSCEFCGECLCEEDSL